MARLIIVSDSHGEVSKIDDILRKYENQYDYFFHLGDRSFDMISFEDKVKNPVIISGNIEMQEVSGKNYGIYEKQIEIEGLKVFATHGHRYSVHSTLLFIKKQARKIGANIVLFGHTHDKHLEFDDGILYFNPGALQNNDYGLIEIKDGEITSVEHAYLSERW